MRLQTPSANLGINITLSHRIKSHTSSSDLGSCCGQLESTLSNYHWAYSLNSLVLKQPHRIEALVLCADHLGTCEPWEQISDPEPPAVEARSKDPDEQRFRRTVALMQTYISPKPPRDLGSPAHGFVRKILRNQPLQLPHRKPTCLGAAPGNDAPLLISTSTEYSRFRSSASLHGSLGANRATYASRYPPSAKRWCAHRHVPTSRARALGARSKRTRPRSTHFPRCWCPYCPPTGRRRPAPARGLAGTRPAAAG